MQKVAVDTPQSRDNPSDVKAEEIPLPPPEMWAELNNNATPAAELVAPAPRKRLPAQQLQFVVSPTVEIPLQYSFVLDGRTVDAIIVRRLTVAEVGDVVDQLPDDFDNFDIFAHMTGLPAPVLRGLVDVDGQALVDAGYDFLPLAFRPEMLPASPPEPADTSST